MKINKKLLALLISVILVIACAASFAFADTATTELTSDLTLSSNVEANYVIPSGSNVTINLNGYSITGASTADVIHVENGATLTIEGTGTVSIPANGTYSVIFNEGTTTLNGGTYVSTSQSGYYVISNHGVMEINDGVTVEDIYEDTRDPNVGSYAALVQNGYGNYRSTNERNGYVSGVNAQYPELTINGGTFIGGRATIKNDDGGVLEINDCEVRESLSQCIVNVHEATINGGTFEIETEGKPVIYSWSSLIAGETTITGGTFTGDIAIQTVAGSLGTNVTVEDGTFTGGYAVDASSTLEISGGTFSADPSNYVVIEMCVEENAGQYTVVSHDTTHQAVDYDPCLGGYDTEFYYCSVCDTYFSDAECTTEIDEVTRTEGSHTIELVAAQDAQIGEEGWIEHEYCSVCDQYFLDGDYENPVEWSEIVIDALPEPTPVPPTTTPEVVPPTTTPEIPSTEPSEEDIAYVNDFVTDLYNNMLGREPDAAGQENWVGQIADGNMSAADVADGFYYSPEFTAMSAEMTTEEYVQTLYRAILGREADPNGLADWVNRIDSGVATREEVYQGFLGSQEFRGIADQIDDIQNTAAHAFVERLYSFVLGRQGDPVGVEHWVDQLASGNMSLRDVAYGFIFSLEYVNNNTSNGDYVTMLYNTILGRQPDSTGYANWTAQLDNGVSRVAVFDGFVQSPEFAGLADVYGYRAY